MAFKVRKRKSGTPMGAMGRLAKVAIALWLGQILLTAVRDAIGQTTIDDQDGFFYHAYKFLGFNSGSNGGAIVIVGVIAVAYVAMEFVDVSF